MSGTSIATTTARSAVLDTIRAEHRTLGSVLELLQHLLRDIAAGYAEADLPLLCSTLYYIDDFACRCHHPKEDVYLFPAIRRHAPQANSRLTGLQAEHHRDASYVKNLHRLLVLYQAGAPAALKRLGNSVDIYAAMLYEHMRKEEALLEEVAELLPEREWQQIGEGFVHDEEPVFGRSPQEEFAQLRTRIANMLPTKMRARRAVDGPGTDWP